MKKHALFVAAALMLAACTNDEVATNGEVALKVNAAISSGTVTRASGTKWADDDRIGISTVGNATLTSYANMPYTWNGSSFAPAGENIYFQDATETVTFSAYYPFAGTAGTAAGTISATTDAGNQTAAAQPKIDFLFATGATASKDKPTVSFTKEHAFSHCMSQLTLTFIEGSDMDLDVDFSYQLEGLKLTGAFDAQQGTAATSADAEAAAITLSLSSVHTQQVDDKYCYTAPSLIFFPQEVATIGLTVTVNNQNYKAELKPKDGNLQPGNNYTWDVTVNKTGLVVGNAEINDWVGVDGGNVDAKM